MTIMLRTSLLLLFVEAAVVGFWNQFFPESFYNNFPTVNLTPPFSEHFARDFGGATLGIAVLLGIALLRPHGRFPLPAATAFSVFAIPTLFFISPTYTASPLWKPVCSRQPTSSRRCLVSLSSHWS